MIDTFLETSAMYTHFEESVKSGTQTDITRAYNASFYYWAGVHYNSKGKVDGYTHD